MNAPQPPVRAEIVIHPRGGRTLAVPIGGASTIRIYSGFFTARPRRRRPPRRNAP